jgi:hypothetical protein
MSRHGHGALRDGVKMIETRHIRNKPL